MELKIPQCKNGCDLKLWNLKMKINEIINENKRVKHL